jgi:hypothetical protein
LPYINIDCGNNRLWPRDALPATIIDIFSCVRDVSQIMLPHPVGHGIIALQKGIFRHAYFASQNTYPSRVLIFRGPLVIGVCRQANDGIRFVVRFLASEEFRLDLEKPVEGR